MVSLSSASLIGCGPKSAQTAGEPEWQPAGKRYVPPPTRSLRARLVQLLEKDRLPTEAEVRALDPAVDSELADLINDPKAKTRLRLAAVACMGYFQNKRAQLLLRTILTDPVWDKPFRIAALSAMARSMGADAYDTIKECASDADVRMRLAAVDALLVLEAPGTLDFLKSLQLRERDPAVLEAIDRGIRSLGRSPMELR